MKKFTREESFWWYLGMILVTIGFVMMFTPKELEEIKCTFDTIVGKVQK